MARTISIKPCPNCGQPVEFIQTTKLLDLIKAKVSKKPGQVCTNCDWWKRNGPHISCYPNGKFRTNLKQDKMDRGYCGSWKLRGELQKTLEELE